MSLEFASTEDLVDELLRRSTHGVVALMGVPVAGTPDGEEWVLQRYKGHTTMCLGVAYELQDFILRNKLSEA